MSPAEIEQVSQNINEYLKSLPTWKKSAEKLDAHPVIRVKNDHNKLESASGLINSLETDLEALRVKCDDKLSKNKQIDERKALFKNLEKQIITNLNACTADLNDIYQLTDNQEINIEEALAKLNALKSDLGSSQALLNKIHQEGNTLIKEDFNDMINVQEILLVLDKEWNNLSENCDESIQNFILMNKAAVDHKKLLDKAKSELVAIQIVNDKEVLNNQLQKPALDGYLDNSKKQLEKVRKIKLQVDDIDRKGNEILKYCENIKRTPPKIQEKIAELKTLWSTTNEKLANQVICFDNVASQWLQMDEIAFEITTWLDDIEQIIADSTENKKEIENGYMRLNKYKIELPSYLNLKTEMENKFHEIQKVNNLQPELLQQIMQNINDRFAAIDDKVRNLNDIASAYTQEEKDFKLKLKVISENINKIREKIIESDDTTGEIESNVENLNRCYLIDQSLADNKKELDALGNSFNTLLEKFPSVKESVLPKEFENIRKRQDVLFKNNDKIKKNLSNHIEKSNKDKIIACSKLIQQQQEKIKWCKPDANSDKYNLEVKLGSLNDVEKSNNECKDKLQEINKSLALISNLPKLNLADLDEMKNKVSKDYDQLIKDYNETKKLLEANIGLWTRYEDLSNGLLADIKDVETKTKAETAYQIDLQTIDAKIQNVQQYKKSIAACKPKLDQLVALGNEINDKNEEAHINQIVNQTTARYNMVVNLIDTILDRLQDHKEKYAIYNADNAKFTTWLGEVKNQTDNLNTLNEPGFVSSKVQLNDLKALLNQIVTRFDDLKSLNEKGEALYTGVTVDNREAIRRNLKQLRNTYETIHKKLNSLIKKLETNITQKTSIEENHEQIKQWLAELAPKINSELFATLPEKKAALHANKTLLQDITLHKGLLQQLESKAVSLSDNDSIQRIAGTAKEYENLLQGIENRIGTCEGHITNHELFDHLVEGFRDDLVALKNNWDENINDALIEKKNINENIQFIENVLKQKKPIDDKLDNCYQQLNIVMNQTLEKGHPELFSTFKAQKDDWLKFISSCEENKNKYEQIKGQWDKFNKTFEDLIKFLKEKDLAIKDQSLKSTHDNKLDHLHLLNQLYSEIKAKALTVSKLNEEVRDSNAEGDFNLKVSQINTKFQTLENMCKDSINRYEIYTNDHKNFNENFEKFKGELKQDMQNLKQHCEIVGNLESLQDIQKRAKELQDKQSSDNVFFDQLITQGENLYPQTNPDGREIIRQQLRTLKNDWDMYSDDLVALTQKVDQCVQQFSEFSDSQEQLSKWLKEVEKSIQSHTELRSTLPEKSLQFQNHKLMHQEILSQTSLVDNVCDKAQQLIDETKDVNISNYLESIKELFKNIVAKSQELQNRLNDSVETHKAYNNQMAVVKNWIKEEVDKLMPCESISGEKNDAIKRIEKLQQIKDNKPNGSAMLQKLDDIFDAVSQSTSPKGNEILLKELSDVKDKYSGIYKDANAYLEKQNETMESWKNFDEQVDELKKWCKANETIFKELPQKNTLSEKEDLLKFFKETQENISQKEGQFDNFVDSSNILLAQTGVEKIKIMSNQLLNRYKLLTVLSKEVVNRSQNILNDHQSYQEKYNEADALLTATEKTVAEATENIDIKNLNKELAQLFNIEKDKLDSVINNLTHIGEKVLPETGSTGREKIRDDIRNMRDRWDKISADFKNIQKSIDTKSHQWTSYQEISQQLSKWLEAIEKSVADEQKSNAVTPQEIRTKILKLKSLSQEILSHNRLVETLNEKSDVIDGNAEEKAINQSINQRYNKVKQSASDLLKNAEKILEVLNNFTEMHKAQLDHQKMLWDKLTIYSDFMGSKSELASKLEKICEMQDHVGQDQAKLQAIKSFLQENANLLPPAITENLNQDSNKMFTEHEKFKASLQKTKQDIKNRLDLWKIYQESIDDLTRLLDDTENSLKNFALKSTLEEKQELLKNFHAVLLTLKQNENEFDLLSDKASELMQSCGESKTTVFVQQLKSRYLSDENAAKEVVKKCEQMVHDHKLYKDKFKHCNDDYNKAKRELDSHQNYTEISDRKELEQIFAKINQLADQHASLNQLMNAIVEIGENLYLTSDVGGREIIRLEIQDLQQKIEELYDGIINLRMKLEFKLSNISGVENLIEKLEIWMLEIKPNCHDAIQLKTTLDEKSGQQQIYDNLLNDINNHQNDIIILKDSVNTLSEKDENLSQKANAIINNYEKYQNLTKNYVDLYETIVNDHQQYCKSVMEAQDFIHATQNTAELWGDVDLDRVSLCSNLDRLKNLSSTLADESHRVKSVSDLGKKVIPNTVESGQINIQQQIDSSNAEWESLLTTIKAVIDSIETKLEHWNEFENLRDGCMEWVRTIENNLHSIDLKSSLLEKKNQFALLKDLQGEIRAKELEIDNVTEKAQILHRSLPNSRNSHVTELVLKYQQLSHKIKDLTTRWQQYYITHQEFDRQISDYTAWLNDLKSKLNFCADLSGNTQRDLENKMTTIQELILLKEEGSGQLQDIVEAAQNVLANTASPGHAPINHAISKLHEEWSQCTMKMIDIRSSLDDSINQWSGFLDEIQSIRKSTESIEALLNDLNDYQTTMAEKRTQLELIRNIEERVRLEKIEVDNLKARTLGEILKGKQSAAAVQAQEVLGKFDNVFERVKKLLSDREEQFRDHRVYKEAYDDLSNYINRAREKIPILQQSASGDKMSVESSVSPLESLLNKQAQGELLLEHLQHTAEVVLASTSSNGQQIIKNDIRELKQNFENLFKEIRKQKEKLEDTLTRWRDYKDEYEKLSEWLQQIDILIKNHKLATHPNLQEKQKQVVDMKDIINKIERQQADFDRFNSFAAPLLESHMEAFVTNQLRNLNSKYQVQTNIAKDVMKKVEGNFNQHKEYEEFYQKARKWLDDAKDIVQSATEGNQTNKDTLKQKLNAIQNLIDRREAGQSLVHNTVSSGEKTVKNTRSDGKEVINQQIKEIQSDWDRLAKKMSTAKVHLETSLLQWADYSSSYNQLSQWITDRETKLQQVTEHKPTKSKRGQPGLIERKANLRQTNDIVQDIVSFEPMIQSVTSKASGLQQQSPATEISTKYETLTKQAKELFAKQKEAVEKHQLFLDAGQEFAQWIRSAKEEINKCSEPTGDKEILIAKMTQIKGLENDIPNGQSKLQKALEQADIACRNGSNEDRETIEEEVANLQGEFDIYV